MTTYKRAARAAQALAKHNRIAYVVLRDTAGFEYARIDQNWRAWAPHAVVIETFDKHGNSDVGDLI